MDNFFIENFRRQVWKFGRRPTTQMAVHIGYLERKYLQWNLTKSIPTPPAQVPAPEVSNWLLILKKWDYLRTTQVATQAAQARPGTWFLPSAA